MAGKFSEEEVNELKEQFTLFDMVGEGKFYDDRLGRFGSLNDYAPSASGVQKWLCDERVGFASN